MRYLFFLLIAFLAWTPLWGQSPQPIHINNPSLEDIPKHARPPIGWFDCGAPRMSPIDTHPSGVFGVEKLPQHGKSYVGMVTRDNYTWEKMGQQLPTPLTPRQGYAFSVYLAQSRFYLSISLRTTIETNYRAPTRLRIWGGFKNCDCRQLLAESQPIEHFEWIPYQFRFVADQAYTHLTFEAFYGNPLTTEGENGHILVDNMSPLFLLDAQQENILPLPVIQLPYSTETPLSEFVKAVGSKLRPNPSQLFWEQHSFVDSDGQQWATNQYAWQLGQALAQHPDKKLIIVIDQKEFTFQQLRTQLIRIMEDAGLNILDDFDIKQWKSRYRKQFWLWPIGRTGITMRVE